MKDKSILVTGGAGFIGSNLVDELVGRGEQVFVLDDLSSGRLDNLNHHIENFNVEMIIGSILNKEVLEPLVARSSLVYHLAAVVGVENVCRNPANTLSVNIEGTRNVLELCRQYGIKVVIASSSEIYGKKDSGRPISEKSDTLLGPTTISRWSYAVSKLASEHLAWSMMKDVPVVILRYFNTYGPRIDPTGYSSVVAKFIEQALFGVPLTVFGDGQQTRCFTYVSDTVAGTIAAGEKASGDVFNIGCTCEISMSELAKKILQLTGSNSEITYNRHPTFCAAFEEARHRKPQNDRAKEKLGFEPRVDLKEGLENTIVWIKSSQVAAVR